jgi:hypothetical protein
LVIGKHTRHSRQVADVAVDYAEERDDRGLVGRDAVEVAHLLPALSGGHALNIRKRSQLVQPWRWQRKHPAAVSTGRKK